MRAAILAGLVAAVTGLQTVEANAALTPMLEFEAGPIATVQVAGGSVSGAGFTATGAPVVGGPGRAVLQFSGNLTLGLFDPEQVSVTEFNLTGLGALNSFISAINGTLPASGGVSWSAYVDPTNTPFGTTDLIASGSFTDPSSVVPLGFTDTVPQIGALSGPFSLTELLTITAPAGDSVAFNSSVTATQLPEPAPIAVLGVGLLGVGLVVAQRRRAHVTVTGAIEHY